MCEKVYTAAGFDESATAAHRPHNVGYVRRENTYSKVVESTHARMNGRARWLAGRFRIKLSLDFRTLDYEASMNCHSGILTQIKNGSLGNGFLDSVGDMHFGVDELLEVSVPFTQDDVHQHSFGRTPFRRVHNRKFQCNVPGKRALRVDAA